MALMPSQARHPEFVRVGGKKEVRRSPHKSSKVKWH